MKFLPLIFLIFVSCQVPTIINNYEQPDEYGTSNDPRLDLISSASDSKWIRKPVASRGIADADPVASQCNEAGWSYIFFDDAGVIGYEPFSGSESVMHDAVRLEVELHNRDNPDKEWDYINVGLPVDPPDTSNDPVLGKWQVALVLDSGTIVRQWQAEFDWEWAMWKGGTIALELELYNRDNEPDAHIVWGTDQ
jgi:hypothetical protein